MTLGIICTPIKQLINQKAYYNLQLQKPQNTPKEGGSFLTQNVPFKIIFV